MKQHVWLGLFLASIIGLVGCASDPSNDVSNESNMSNNESGNETENVDEETLSSASQGEGGDAVTSASLVPENFISDFEPKGFSEDETVDKALFVIGDPRKYSVNYDLANTAMAHFESKGVEVEVRDLYDLDFNPVLSEETFYHAKDGTEETPEDVAVEQSFVNQADHIIFVYPNWHDTPNAMVKGYMERVFAKQYAYQDGDEGLEGLLTDKDIYTIMNCGYLGGGRGFIGDGIGQDDETWDSYMQAFKVLDDDTANFWGAENRGRFVNDQTPSNHSESYEEELDQLRESLKNHLDNDFF